MSRSLRFSRWRRLPGAHRVFEKRLPTHAETLQRVTVYLPGQIVEHAEALARLEGVAHAQAYCEGVLTGAIQAEVARRRVDATPPDRPTEDDIEEQADQLAREQGAAGGFRSSFALRLVETAEPGQCGVETEAPPQLALPRPSGSDEQESGDAGARVERESSSEAVARVLRHAGVERTPANGGFLDAMRRGQAVSPVVASELLTALDELDAERRSSGVIERPLAHALFRLAFESQVLLTDAWPKLGEDAVTLALVRRVQEVAERVLSGLDVRYERLADRGGGVP